MSDAATFPANVRFFTLAVSREELSRVRLMVSTLREFGGPWRDCLVHLFLAGTAAPERLDDLHGVEIIRFQVAGQLHYSFSAKVETCARAETIAAAEVSSLVWLSPECLILNPPDGFSLSPEHAAAFRPVHIRNVGLPTGAPLNDYWSAVCRAVGVPDWPGSVESFVEGEPLRPYYDTHLFAIDPSLGILREWWELFKKVVLDPEFRTGPGRDARNRIFLHQALLSVLVATRLQPGQVRILPPEYGYPLHLHPEVPASRQARRLNDLVCAVYEPGAEVLVLPVDEPLRSWLAPRLAALNPYSAD